MMGPDYTQWHGFYEVAKHFYTEFIPQAKELAHDNVQVTAVIDEIMNRPEHRWNQGLSKEERDKITDFYMKRYGK